MFNQIIDQKPYRLMIEYYSYDKAYYFDSYKEAFTFLKKECSKKHSYGGSIVTDWDINGY